MGAITSKHVAEPQKEFVNGTSGESPPQNVTPRNARVLPFDPRSPSDNVNRTPITISENSNKGTPNVKSLKALPIDPRSPTVEVTRTPLLVEEPMDRKKYLPIKPSKLADICFTPEDLTSSKDPRSPSDKVPRTPLEEDRDSKSEGLPTRESNSETTPVAPTSESLMKEAKINLNSKIFEASDKQDRRPLTDLQNRSSNQPRHQLQALQFRNVEEELAKSEKMILNKLEKDDELKTATEFVETI